ncbi:MAG: hypothetical protein ACI861_002668 [Paracoccaceae bacterium]|jgi:uncharacterized protein (TIGR00255 family)
MVNSMTGFAALKGSIEGAHWAWEARSVNARGLDIRLRLPEGLGDLEALVRKTLSAALTRGNVSLSLRLTREAHGGMLALEQDQLDVVLSALKTAELRAENVDLHLTASSAADILALRGVLDTRESNDGDQSELVNALKAQVVDLTAAFVAARRDEGSALHAILADQLGQIDGLVKAAQMAANARQKQVSENFRENLDKILGNSEGLDEGRIAQELALLAVKADITEEIDRLAAHIEAGAELLNSSGAVGRKFGFLMQEFNREANTLCSKSGSTDLTRIGLDLKTVIDQMREQVQNVE